MQESDEAMAVGKARSAVSEISRRSVLRVGNLKPWQLGRSGPSSETCQVDVIHVMRSCHVAIKEGHVAMKEGHVARTAGFRSLYYPLGPQESNE